MQPWNVNTSSADDEKIEFERRVLWADMRAKDFYFAIIEGKEQDEFSTTVFIVPIDYFEEHHKMLEKSMPIMHIVPEYLVEIFDCTFETKYNSVMVCNHLSRLGMIKGIKFQKWINETLECDPTEN